MNHIGKTEFLKVLGIGICHSLFSLSVIVSSLWLCMALWIQEPFGWLISRILIGIWLAFALSIFLAVKKMSLFIFWAFCVACFGTLA